MHEMILEGWIKKMLLSVNYTSESESTKEIVGKIIT